MRSLQWGSLPPSSKRRTAFVPTSTQTVFLTCDWHDWLISHHSLFEIRARRHATHLIRVFPNNVRKVYQTQRVLYMFWVGSDPCSDIQRSSCMDNLCTNIEQILLYIRVEINVAKLPVQCEELAIPITSLHPHIPAYRYGRLHWIQTPPSHV
jgi:hypothetical protein